jgi:hypothetical protein
MKVFHDSRLELVGLWIELDLQSWIIILTVLSSSNIEPAISSLSKGNDKPRLYLLSTA